MLAALLLAGCERSPEASDDAAAGRALEAAALDAGIVADPADAVGVYAAGEDRVCMARIAPDRYRIGVSVDYGAGQRCIAHGTARGRATLDVDLGAGCRVKVSHDGDRLSFPAQTPAKCAPLCQGRAALDALTVDRLSGAGGEAARLRGADGALLCTD